MPPPKKGAGKLPATHAHAEPSDPKDLRRAFEHLGRVEALQRASAQNDSAVSTLATLAHQQLRAGHAKDAADLLRAAEHLSFATSMAMTDIASELPPELQEAIQHEFNHLVMRAEEHWEHVEERDRHPQVIALHHSSLDAAKKARQQGNHRQSLELARGAEALAHVKKHGSETIAIGKESLHLRAS